MPPRPPVLPDSPPTPAGLDGCRAGWILARAHTNNQFSLHFFPDLKSALASLPQGSPAFIDIPLGLPGKSFATRQCDQLARQILRSHSARVFSPPTREAIALHPGDYPKACHLNHALTGRKISRQAWNIAPKIREADSLLRDPANSPSLEVRESHPELLFTALNAALPVAPSKKTPEGQNKRLSLLSAVFPGCQSHLHSFISQNRPIHGRFAPDDLIDAAVLCLAASSPQNWISLPANPPLDDFGIPTRITTLSPPRNAPP